MKDALLLDYLSNYGLDSALKNISPKALSQYVDLAKGSNSLLRDLITQEGVQILSGKVVSIDTALAVDLATDFNVRMG